MAGSATPGGVATVIETYRQAGLFERWPIMHLVSHSSYGEPAFRKVRHFAGTLWVYLCLLLTRRVALLHAHTSARGSFWRKYMLAALTRLFGRPVIVHLHSGEFIDFYEHECGRLGQWAVRRFLDQATRIVVLSESWRERIRAITGNDAVTVISNPVLVDPSPCEPGLRKPHRVLFMGRLTAKKGLFDFLEAAAPLAERFNDLEVVCAGDGDRETARRAAESLGLGPAVQFPGWVQGADKTRLLASCGLFVLPSHAEGLPMSVMEAMASGLPVIATRVGGVPDLVTHEGEGLLVGPGDKPALQRAMSKVLADPSLAEAFGRRGRDRAWRQFRVEIVLEGLGDLYRSLGVGPRAAGT